MNGTTDVECPICGIWGKMSIEDGKVKVTFSEEEKNRARNTTTGIYEHYNEIQKMIEICVPKLTQNDALIKKEMERYKNFDEIVGNK